MRGMYVTLSRDVGRLDFKDEALKRNLATLRQFFENLWKNHEKNKRWTIWFLPLHEEYVANKFIV